ncbi:MBL fold metallo-hydrolase [Roseibacillus ishigakijimensis]|uniref:MBL fold metallo-hydrolase n=1 Tax=Roseibacillus ishigakijimensis TaxID=454146 RepID=A0A934RSP4_9BACT|nr:MBL fold metallo-hydrolase [Roseibacillus ishigakijimensis]MBK1834339.1 MBL fold metallo-hydrolase [Roseibacillus ishigakijimensis]
MSHDSLFANRRHFLTTSLASGLGLTALARGEEGEKTAPQTAAPGPLKRAPSVYKFRIGEAEAWSISDAYFIIGGDLNLMWPREDHARMEKVLATEGRRMEEALPLYANILVVRNEKETVIFDAGFGGEERDRMGWLLSGLALAGITPDSVTAAFLSHSHSDHLNGFVREGKPTFPNAELHLLQSEIDFWRAPEPDFSETKRNRNNLPGMIRTVRAHFDSLEEVMTAHKQEKTTLLDGLVTIEPAPGHTTGHACFRIRSGGEELLHLMDLAHHDLLMFADPNWTIAFDHHPQQSVATRKVFWKEAAHKTTRCYGFHLPFPGLGTIVESGPGYRWAAEPWKW